ncbi:MAG TPA: bifunctional riboflavin kinase/FAD synthetase [Polyangiaceae bacterium]
MVRRIDGASSLEHGPRSRLVAIGNFDGVHRGHRAVIEAALREAHERRLSPVALTFHPHPALVLGRGAQAPLTTLARKVELLCSFSDELTVVVEPFTVALSELSPAAFAADCLVERLGASVVIVGDNFRFGHQRAGGLADLTRLGAELGFAAHSSTLSGDGEGPFSSTRVRAALARGDLASANHVLGRPHSLSGRVVHGDARGRSIGVPTANLAEVAEALPPNGVYAVLVDRSSDGVSSALGRGVANIGVRPTSAAGFSVEAHLFDFDRDLYGQRLRLHLVARLRDERKFSGLDELKAQISRDILAARSALSSIANPGGAAWY